MAYFKIIPILGLRTDVPIDDKTLFRFLSSDLALTHATGVDDEFDLMKKRNTVSKQYGRVEYSSANGQNSNCLGLFYLFDGTNRNYITIDKGKVFYLDGSKVPQDVTGALTLASDPGDIYSMVQVGSHIVMADRGEHTPYCWKHGDAAISKATNDATREWKFRYLTYFAQRLFGLYSDQTNGDIDIRWTGVIPVPGTTCVWADANQLYVPNDDSISGVAKMGEDTLFVLCDNSIQQIIHYQSNLTPFQAYTVVADQGCSAPHSVVALSDRIYFYNSNYGFCEYRGGNQFPYGGKPISDPINSLALAETVRGTSSYIVGKYIPFRRQIIWTTHSAANDVLIFDIDTGNWSVNAQSIYYLDVWDTLSGSSLTSKVYFQSSTGIIYTHEGNIFRLNPGTGYTNTDVNFYRTEPVLDFGNPKRTDLLTEIWFDIPVAVVTTITVQWRGGNTLGELAAASFATVGTLSANSPSHPFVPVNKSARLHQIYYYTSGQTDFQCNGITFKYQPGSER